MSDWALLWYSRNKLDGVQKHILRDRHCRPVIFKKRWEARDYANREYGYIKTRKDLREEPHGWRMPIPVKIKIEVIK